MGILVLFLIGAVAALAAAPSSASRDLTVTIDGPSTSVDNATVSFNMTTHNTGTGAGATSETQFYLDGNATGPLYDFGNLGDGEIGSAIQNLTLACGIYTINATVDPADRVPESNETNNNFTRTLVVTPFASFTSNRTGDLGNYTYTFNASASHGCAPLNFTWTINGVTRYGAVVSTQPPAGNLSVSLAVRAGNVTLLTGLANQSIVVPNARPTVVLTLADNSIPTLWPLGLQIGFDDSDGSVVSVSTNYGDGNSSIQPVNAATYEYRRGGNFTIVVVVVDNLGANNSSSVVVEITDRAPVIHASFPAWETSVGVAVPFDASGSTDPEGAPLNMTWDFGDGTTGSGSTANHTYTQPGTYTVRVTATDGNGQQSQETILVRVDPNPSGGDAGLWWLPLLFLLLIALLLLVVLARRRREEPPKDAAAPVPPPPAGQSPPAGEGSSPKPPSP